MREIPTTMGYRLAFMVGSEQLNKLRKALTASTEYVIMEGYEQTFV